MEKGKFIEIIAIEGLASWERTPEKVARMIRLFDEEDIVETLDTLEDFKKNSAEFKGVRNLEGITVLENFQFKKGDTRISLYFTEGENGNNYVYKI